MHLQVKTQETTIDPKFDLIKKSIRRSLKNDSKRKIIIFTEFSDTAIYLQEQLKKSNIRSMLYTSKHASKTARQRIRENFDAGYPNGLQVDDYDVLVATDAISEGYSLHRAGTIYNYDIPYNPTRVIQRVGRINRVNLKVFDELFIFNFFPTATGETISHTAEISTFKMRLFQAILGSDTQILTEEETLEGYLENEFVSAQNEEDMESWDVPYRNELDRIMYNESNEFEKAINLPHRCRIARKNTHLNFEDKSFSEDQLFEDLENEGVLLFSQKGDSYRFIFTSKSGSSINLNPEQAFALFKSTKEERGYSVSDDFYPLYERAKESSGIVKANRKHSKIIRDARKRLQLIKKSLDDITEQSYVDAVLEIIELDSLPLFYARKLARIAPIKESVFSTV
jgi:superfamily II DNA/RNA helicase